MEVIILIGIPASGKSSFYLQRFSHSHLLISLDILRTRNKQRRFIELCLETGQKFVMDNTNPTIEERAEVIALAHSRKFRVVGYYFQSQLEAALQRNATRVGKKRIADAGVRSVYSNMIQPTPEEGFDELYYVRIHEGEFVTEEWKSTGEVLQRGDTNEI